MLNQQFRPHLADFVKNSPVFQPICLNEGEFFDQLG